MFAHDNSPLNNFFCKNILQNMFFIFEIQNIKVKFANMQRVIKSVPVLIDFT